VVPALLSKQAVCHRGSRACAGRIRVSFL